MRVLATSRQYVIVPAGRLTARPSLDPVDVAFMPDDGTEPAGPDWITAPWLAGPAGQVLGAGRLIGSGGGAEPLPPGAWMIYVREHLPGGETPAWAWTRLTIGL